MHLIQLMQTVRDTRRGNAAVEMAIAVPVLFAMVFGAIDFGRVHLEASVVKNSSAIGSFYGAQSMQYSNDSTGIQAAATGDAGGIAGFSVTNDLLCQCLNANGDYDSGVTEVSCGDADCGAYGVPRVYVRTRSQKTFSTLGWYPGVPQDTTMDMTGWVRVQ
jgi:Flp pilus assembly protein TadG